MTTVGTAQLKAHLSAHLQSVRRGDTIIVLDRNEPIAMIVPISNQGAELVVRPAKGSLQEVPLLGPIGADADILDDLGLERRERL
jgi:prevent-host-death family protein